MSNPVKQYISGTSFRNISYKMVNCKVQSRRRAHSFSRHSRESGEFSKERECTESACGALRVPSSFAHKCTALRVLSALSNATSHKTFPLSTVAMLQRASHRIQSKSVHHECRTRGTQAHPTCPAMAGLQCCFGSAHGGTKAGTDEPHQQLRDEEASFARRHQSSSS